jgi:hypothetical protein
MSGVGVPLQALSSKINSISGAARRLMVSLLLALEQRLQLVSIRITR